jgi:hypothetical protein
LVQVKNKFHKEDYGVNGRHKDIGKTVNDAEFKGRVLEFMKTIEKGLDTRDADLKQHQRDDNIHFKTLEDAIHKQDEFNKILVGMGIILALGASAIIGKLINLF